MMTALVVIGVVGWSVCAIAFVIGVREGMRESQNEYWTERKCREEMEDGG